MCMLSENLMLESRKMPDVCLARIFGTHCPINKLLTVPDGITLINNMAIKLLSVGPGNRQVTGTAMGCRSTGKSTQFQSCLCQYSANPKNNGCN